MGFITCCPAVAHAWLLFACGFFAGLCKRIAFTHTRGGFVIPLSANPGEVPLNGWQPVLKAGGAIARRSIRLPSAKICVCSSVARVLACFCWLRSPIGLVNGGVADH